MQHGRQPAAPSRLLRLTPLVLILLWLILLARLLDIVFLLNLRSRHRSRYSLSNMQCSWCERLGGARARTIACHFLDTRTHMSTFRAIRIVRRLRFGRHWGFKW
jgi:hypothetical protein